MKTQKKYKVSILTFVVCMAMTGTLNAQSNAKQTDPKKNMHNEKLVTDAYSSGIAEVRIAENVQNRTTSPEIKALAATMISDHSTLNAKLKTLAANEKITLKTELTSEQQNDLDKLQKKSGMDLDAAYVDMLVSSHKKSVDLYEKGSRCDDDAEIRAYFAEALPKIKSHLEHVTRLDDKYDKDSKTGLMKKDE